MANILALKNPNTRDKNIKRNLKSHQYNVNSNQGYISVTTLINNFYSFPEYPSDTLKIALIKGTNLHSDIEYHYKTGDHKSDSVEYIYFLNFVKYYTSKQIEPYRSEWSVFNEDIMLSGTVDMVFKNADGSYCIYDWKRSKNILSKQLDRYTMQLNLYMHILVTKYDMKIRSLHILCLHPENNNYKIIDVQKIELRSALDKLKSLIFSRNEKMERMINNRKYNYSVESDIQKSMSKSSDNSRDSYRSRITSINGNKYVKTNGTRRKRTMKQKNEESPKIKNENEENTKIKNENEYNIMNSEKKSNSDESDYRSYKKMKRDRSIKRSKKKYDLIFIEKLLTKLLFEKEIIKELAKNILLKFKTLHDLRYAIKMFLNKNIDTDIGSDSSKSSKSSNKSSKSSNKSSNKSSQLSKLSKLSKSSKSHKSHKSEKSENSNNLSMKSNKTSATIIDDTTTPNSIKSKKSSIKSKKSLNSDITSPTVYDSVTSDFTTTPNSKFSINSYDYNGNSDDSYDTDKTLTH